MADAQTPAVEQGTAEASAPPLAAPPPVAPTGGQQVRVRPVNDQPGVLSDLFRLAAMTFGRVVLYGGLAAALLLAGALWGVWEYADDQRLPDTFEEWRSFKPYISRLDERRERPPLSQQLTNLDKDVLSTLASVHRLEESLKQHALASYEAGNMRWCTTLLLNRKTSDFCSAYTETIEAELD